MQPVFLHREANQAESHHRPHRAACTTSFAPWEGLGLLPLGLTRETFYLEDKFSMQSSRRSLLQICFLSRCSLGCCLGTFACAAVWLWELAWDHIIATCLLTADSYWFSLKLYYRLLVFLKAKLKTSIF